MAYSKKQISAIHSPTLLAVNKILKYLPITDRLILDAAIATELKHKKLPQVLAKKAIEQYAVASHYLEAAGLAKKYGLHKEMKEYGWKVVETEMENWMSICLRTDASEYRYNPKLLAERFDLTNELREFAKNYIQNEGRKKHPALLVFIADEFDIFVDMKPCFTDVVMERFRLAEAERKDPYSDSLWYAVARLAKRLGLEHEMARAVHNQIAAYSQQASWSAKERSKEEIKFECKINEVRILEEFGLKEKMRDAALQLVSFVLFQMDQPDRAATFAKEYGVFEESRQLFLKAWDIIPASIAKELGILEEVRTKVASFVSGHMAKGNYCKAAAKTKEYELFELMHDAGKKAFILKMSLGNYPAALVAAEEYLSKDDIDAAKAVYALMPKSDST